MKKGITLYKIFICWGVIFVSVVWIVSGLKKYGLDFIKNPDTDEANKDLENIIGAVKPISFGCWLFLIYLIL